MRVCDLGTHSRGEGRLPRPGNPVSARPARRGRGSLRPRRNWQLPWSRRSCSQWSRDPTFASRFSPRSARLQIARLAGAAEPPAPYLACPWHPAWSALAKVWGSSGGTRGYTVAAARRAPDAKALADPRVPTLLRACRVPAPAEASTKIGIAAAAAAAGAAPRTRPSPRRAPAGGAAGLRQGSPPSPPAPSPRRYSSAQFETPASFFPRFLSTSRFCPCLGMSGGRAAAWGQWRRSLISMAITRAVKSQQGEKSG